MRPAVKIDDLTDALDMVSPESAAWLDRETGRVLIIEDRIMADADSDDPIDPAHLPDWEAAELIAARDLLRDPGRGIELPTAFDFHEYSHMERFIGTLANPDDSGQLMRAIKGRGAFRHFKDTAHRLGVIDAWYAYRDDAARTFMLDWARAHDIPVDESPGRSGM